MSPAAPAVRIEPRWPVVSTILVTLVLLAALPARIRLFPSWVPGVAGGVVMFPMFAVMWSAEHDRWLIVEKVTTLLFVIGTGAANVATLMYLINAMIHHAAEFDGLHLLASSVAVWTTSVLLFSLVYWQLDRGGPESRLSDAEGKPDWLFVQAPGQDDRHVAGRPAFVDYLFLSFTTSTAFSPTDTLPLTGRAKMLMMLQSVVSLATIVVVASRAINILGN